jgi:hypothetical protein
MTKQNGLGDGLLVGGYDLSGDIGSIKSIRGPMVPSVVTGINKSAVERVGGLRDGGMDYTAWFNPDTAAAHPVLSALPTTDQVAMYLRGTTLGSPAACLVGKQLNYAPTRAADASLSIEITMVANSYGVEWGVQHTAGLRADTAATNGTGVDGTAATDFGLQAYLEVSAFTGTSVTVKLQESSDNGSTDAWADVTGGGFTAVSAARATQRIETARDLTVERYLRVVTTGTFTAATFCVVVVRNQTEVLF